MDLAMTVQLVKNQLAAITAVRDAENATRDAVSGDGLNSIVKRLFPGVQDDFLAANADFPNHLQKGVSRYVMALTRGELNWEWTEDGDAPTDGTPAALLGAAARDILQSITVDALCTGKIALFPYLDEAGELQLSVPSGFLWPVFKAGNSNVIEAVLQVTPYTSSDGKPRFEVRRFTPGLLEVFSNLEKWEEYATSSAREEFPQRHASGRLPLAFSIANRDAKRLPEGLAQAAMPAFMAYVKARVMLNFIAELGGFEERVVKSNKLFEIARKNPQDPMLAAMRQVGPRKIRLVSSEDTYERLAPVGLKEYQAQERQAVADLRDAMNIPDTDGADLAGVALQEKREAYTETVGSLAALIADALTDALALAAALKPGMVRPGWRVTLTPRFTQDVQAERTFIVDAFSKGALPSSAALSGLQSLGATYVTDDMVARAAEREAGDVTPTVLPAEDEAVT